MSEIENSFFSNLYIIKILGRSITVMCEKYRFMREIQLCKILLYILCKYWDFKDFITNV